MEGALQHISNGPICLILWHFHHIYTTKFGPKFAKSFRRIPKHTNCHIYILPMPWLPPSSLVRLYQSFRTPFIRCLYFAPPSVCCQIKTPPVATILTNQRDVLYLEGTTGAWTQDTLLKKAGALTNWAMVPQPWDKPTVFSSPCERINRSGWAPFPRKAKSTL